MTIIFPVKHVHSKNNDGALEKPKDRQVQREKSYLQGRHYPVLWPAMGTVRVLS